MNVEYTILCHPDDEAIEGNAIASGDEAEDKAEEDRILRALQDGNEWAWCTVEVQAYVPGVEDFHGSTFLGGCSYEGEEDFKAGGYYEQMMQEALADLKEKVRLIAASLDEA